MAHVVLWGAVLAALTALVPAAARAAPTVGAAPVPGMTAPPAPALKSHTAVYKMTLLRADQRDGLRGANGRLRYTLIDRCEGYTVESELNGQFSFSNGLTSTVRQTYAGWESKDGRRASFRLQSQENGSVSESFRGTVELNEDRSGRARYEGDQTAVHDLPAGTLLATAQVRALIELALQGPQFFSQVVMDGAFAEGPHRVTGVIAPASARMAASGSAAAEILAIDPDFDLSRPAWPVSMAYFPLNDTAETPSYEMTIQLRDDGVVTGLTQDFGGYTLGFQPVGLTAIEEPSC